MAVLLAAQPKFKSKLSSSSTQAQFISAQPKLTIILMSLGSTIQTEAKVKVLNPDCPGSLRDPRSHFCLASMASWAQYCDITLHLPSHYAALPSTTLRLCLICLPYTKVLNPKESYDRPKAGNAPKPL